MSNGYDPAWEDGYYDNFHLMYAHTDPTYLARFEAGRASRLFQEQQEREEQEEEEEEEYYRRQAYYDSLHEDDDSLHEDEDYEE